MKKSILFAALFSFAMMRAVDGEAAAAPADPTALVGDGPSAATDAATTAATGAPVQLDDGGTGAVDGIAEEALDTAETEAKSWIEQELSDVVAAIEAGVHNGVDALKSIIAKL